MRSAGCTYRWFDALDFAAKDEAEQLIDGAVVVLTGNHVHLEVGLRSAAVGMEEEVFELLVVLVLRSLRLTGAARAPDIRREKTSMSSVRMVMMIERCETNVSELLRQATHTGKPFVFTD